MKLYNPNQLKQDKFEQTSSGVNLNDLAFDRESGKTFIIHYPSFGLVMSGASLPVRLDRPGLSRDNLIKLAKCLIILQFLPEEALEETTGQLEGIYRFYKDREAQIGLPKPSVNKIKGKLQSKQVHLASLESKHLKLNHKTKNRKAILQIINTCANLPTFDPRNPDEILGYNEDAIGLWGDK
jgi:hypothetical protein